MCSIFVLCFLESHLDIWNLSSSCKKDYVLVFIMERCAICLIEIVIILYKCILKQNMSVSVDEAVDGIFGPQINFDNSLFYCQFI